MQCMGECSNYIFTPFDPAPCDKKSRSEHQTLFPLFGEGSGHETSIDLLSTTRIPPPPHPHTPLPPLTLPTCTDTSISVSRTVFNLVGQVGNDDTQERLFHLSHLSSDIDPSLLCVVVIFQAFPVSLVGDQHERPSPHVSSTETLQWCTVNI